MKILITGSRNWSDRDAVKLAILEFVAVGVDRDFAPSDITVVHGDAPGADTLAKSVAEEYGLTPEPHPADWKKYGKAAGPIRNQEMVDLGADVCLAFPDEDSNGTLDCMARAVLAEIETYNCGFTNDELNERYLARVRKLMEG